MVLGKKTGCCTICKKKGRTDWHHIISQHHARRTGQEELITDPNNVIELCRRCHDQTTASMVRKRLNKQGKPVKKSGRPMKKVLPKVQAKLSASEIRRISKLNEQERIQDCKKRCPCNNRKNLGKVYRITGSVGRPRAELYLSFGTPSVFRSRTLHNSVF